MIPHQTAAFCAAPGAVFAPSGRTLVAYRPRPFTLDRELLEVPEGLTLLEMVALAYPDAGTRAFVHAKIDDTIVERRHWHRVRPKPGRIVHLAMLPAGGQVLRTVLTIAVVAAALYATGGTASLLGGAVGASVPLAGVLAVEVVELPAP